MAEVDMQLKVADPCEEEEIEVKSRAMLLQKENAHRGAYIAGPPAFCFIYCRFFQGFVKNDILAG